MKSTQQSAGTGRASPDRRMRFDFPIQVEWPKARSHRLPTGGEADENEAADKSGRQRWGAEPLTLKPQTAKGGKQCLPGSFGDFHGKGQICVPPLVSMQPIVAHAPAVN